jgi:AcrR family transcriptional regulator
MIARREDMRADAVRHRTILLEAASRVFARDGVDAPLEAVLQEAKLGRGTLYRHFPHREALLIATLKFDIENAAEFVSSDNSSATFLRDFLRMQALTAALFTPAFRQIEYSRIEDAVPLLIERIDELYAATVRFAHRNGEMRSAFDSRALRRAVRMVAAGAVPNGPDTGDEMEEALDMIMIALA